MTTARERQLGWPGRIALSALVVFGSALAATDLITLVLYASYAVVAAVLMVRRPRNVIGWILLAIAWSLLGTSMLPYVEADVPTVIANRTSARDDLLLWINAWAGAASYVCYLALTILFPSGSLPTGRWRRPAIVALVVGIGIVLVTAFAPTIEYNPGLAESGYAISNPFAILPDVPILPSHGEQILVIIALVAIGAGSMIVRYLQSTGVLRLQLRWFVAALAFLVLSVAFAFATILALGSDGGFAWIPALFAYPSVPLAIGVAVLRYRLYEIDRLISRTIGYAIVTGVLVAVFAAAVLGLQAVLEPLTGENTVAVAASTLIVAALFQPLRRRIQRAVDRRFDRARYDGQRVVDAFALQLRDEVDLDRLRTELVATANDVVRPVSATVWLRSPEGTR